ncbi:prolipoprotein diacylglyceryl transferase [Kangiella shandongensis]|uniref:prolipoprotein diacylglyceryl transferase n=1 Tax=Kangiella shandongensis TaxID=2763258 RepID=UPI001F2B2596
MEFPEISPVIFEIGPIALHWYGFMYLLGFLAAWGLGTYRAKQPNSGWTAEQVSDFLFYGFIGVILGGRIGYVLFYGLEFWADDPWYPFKIWEGGMAFHGGILGVAAAGWYFARKNKKGFFEVGDFIVPLAPLGLMFGRLGNFINGELWGRQAAEGFPLAMRFPDDSLGLLRHPSQLYQAAFEGLLLFLIVWFYSAKPRPRKAVSGLFLTGYGVFRFGVEFFREPDAHLGKVISWLTMGQVLCVPMIALGIYWLYSAYSKPQQATK